jgi:hypothetical protein
MVLEVICVDSEWHWPEDPEFCPGWQGCTYTPPYELHCKGRAEGLPSRLPNYLDPRLTIVSANFYRINRHKTTTRLPRLEHLNLSHNVITELTTLALQQTSLRVLDLSFNKITYISSAHLPTSGTLDQLYLTGNTIQEYAPLALYSAMSRCQTANANESDAVASFNMVLEAPGCEFALDVGVGRGSSDLLYCVTTRCEPTLQAVPFEACDSQNIVSKKNYELRTRCDSIVNCASGEDEAACQGTMELENIVGAVAHGVCGVIVNFFQSSYTLRYGVVAIPLTETGRITLGVDIFTFAVDRSQAIQEFTADDIFRSASIEAAFVDDRFIAIVNYSLASVPESQTCTVSYLLNPVQATSGSTSLAPITSASSGASPQAAAAAAAGGATAGLVCLCLLLILIFRRRSRSTRELERELEMEVGDASIHPHFMLPLTHNFARPSPRSTRLRSCPTRPPTS